MLSLAAYASFEVVEDKSAFYPGIGEPIPIRSNHINICKFAAANDNGYKAVKAKIIEIIQGGKEDDNKSVRNCRTTPK